jgi:hypothetical protein
MDKDEGRILGRTTRFFYLIDHCGVLDGLFYR